MKSIDITDAIFQNNSFRYEDYKFRSLFQFFVYQKAILEGEYSLASEIQGYSSRNKFEEFNSSLNFDDKNIPDLLEILMKGIAISSFENKDLYSFFKEDFKYLSSVEPLFVDAFNKTKELFSSELKINELVVGDNLLNFNSLLEKEPFLSLNTNAFYFIIINYESIYYFLQVHNKDGFLLKSIEKGFDLASLYMRNASISYVNTEEQLVKTITLTEFTVLPAFSGLKFISNDNLDSF